MSASEGMREVNFFQWTPPPSVYHSNPCICKESDVGSIKAGTANHGIIEVRSGDAVAVCEVSHDMVPGQRGDGEIPSTRTQPL